MTKTMLIDASHAEETRVVVVDGNRLDDFDIETAGKKQIKGNIYLAKVIRVEPSLQAAFVEYGGNRHGFLAFAEIHPDYYQIPVADRERLLRHEAEEARRRIEAEDAEDAAEQAADARRDGRGQRDGRGRAQPLSRTRIEITASAPDSPESDAPGPAVREPVVPSPEMPDPVPTDPASPDPAVPEDTAPDEVIPVDFVPIDDASSEVPGEIGSGETGGDLVAPDGSVQTGQNEYEDSLEWDAQAGPKELPVEDADSETGEPKPLDLSEPSPEGEPDRDEDEDEDSDNGDDVPVADRTRLSVDRGDAGSGPQPEIPADYMPPETLGGESDAAEEAREVRRARPMRSYKIQEVIHRRQILLVQVVKEERGNKGAALTTYLSLAGRFSVLMPNSPNGGGVSRKITSVADRRRLKEAVAELDIPEGMGLIVRTAGANRPKPEIKRDCEYLMRLWDDIRERTLASVAPSLIYEEANLIKRTIRDVYTRDIDEVLVEGEEGFRAAHEFMTMLMPSHVKKVQPWRDGQPLFAKYQVEAQLDQMFQPVVQLRSGGYLVINQTEALVAIDVNSGRSTRERNVEDMAVRTNMEAAEEVARQLRLRDLAGLIVIDFIDMESRKHNAMVERKLKEALKNDRARIQVGSISHFGLLEMSRQRLRPSLSEAMLIPCAHCGGTGHVRSTATLALAVLRGIEDEGAKGRAAEIAVHLSPDVAIYIFNHKRARLSLIEQRFGMSVRFVHDEKAASQFRIETLRVQSEEARAETRPEAARETAREARTREVRTREVRAPLAMGPEPAMAEAEEEEADEAEAPHEASPEASLEASQAKSAEEGERRRRRRRRRRPRREGGPAEGGTEQPGDHAEPAVEFVEASVPEAAPEPEPGAPIEAAPPQQSTFEESLPEVITTLMPELVSEPDIVAAITAELGVLPPAPDEPVPEAATPELAKPELATPELATPEAAMPEAAMPEAASEPVEKPRRRTRARTPRAKREAPAPQPDVPVYADIADIFEAAEQAELVKPAPESVSAGPVSAGPVSAGPAAPAPVAPAPEPVLEEPILEAGAETALETGAEPPEPAPLVQPVVIGADEPAEKKRGWWRR